MKRIRFGDEARSARTGTLDDGAITAAGRTYDIQGVDTFEHSVTR